MGTVISSDTSASFVGTINFSELPVDFFPSKLRQTESKSLITQDWGALSEQSFSLAHCTHSHQVAKEEGAGRKEIIMSNLT